jgi:uncharacterized small protein (DUF1192 family)
MLAAGLALIGCGPPAPPMYGGPAVGPGGKPAWVDGRPARYPDMQYLSGVGRGPSRGACENDAYAALAKIFNAKIQQVSQDWQGHFSRVSNLGTIKVEQMSISQLTRVSTDKVLKGAKIAENWQGEGTNHCLGVLERDPAVRSLQSEISRLDAEIKAQVDKGDSAATPTARFMAYARAMELLQEREALNVDLRIVSPRGVGMPPAIDFAALVAKFTTSKGKIKVGLKLTGTRARQIQTCLAEELTKKGIEVLEGTSDVDVMIHGNLKYEKAGFIAGSHMVRANVNLRLTDAENGRTVGAFHDNIKVGRPTLQASVQLAVFKLCQQVMPQLTQKVRAAFSR